MKPMLAATIDDINVLYKRYPLLASPKLDGIRALVCNGTVVSRNLKPIPNKHVQKLFSHLPDGFDGELICGSPNSETCFRDTTSGCMTADGVPEVVFYVFDCYDCDRPLYAPYNQRYKELQEFFKRYKNKNVKLLQNKLVKSMEDILVYEGKVVREQKYEGVMLRDPWGFYKEGRSTLKEGYLMKLKRFEDSEAVILRVDELQHNNNTQTKDALGHSKRSSHKAGKVGGGVMGALGVQDIHTGVKFDIGAGFKSDERESIYQAGNDVIGKVIKYKFFPTGSKDKPRFPVFLGFRDIIDI